MEQRMCRPRRRSGALARRGTGAGRGSRGLWAGLAILFVGMAGEAQVIMKEPPEPLRDLELVPQVGERVPMELQFTDSTGQRVRLERYFNRGHQPVILALVYYGCPMMCPLVLDRLQDRLNGLEYVAGRDFALVVVSFGAGETAAQAAEARAAFLAGYRHRGNEVPGGVAFHVSDAGSVRRLADAVGFPYRYIPQTGQYAHGAVLTVLTPDGRISGYLDALGAEAREFRMALLEASQGRLGRSLSDFFLHLCYRFDPTQGRYTLQAMRIMQAGGLMAVVGLGGLVGWLWAWERTRRAARSPRPTATTKSAVGPVGVAGSGGVPA